MTAGYAEFEFDLPSALLARLIEVLDTIPPAPMTLDNLNQLPDAQGVYQLYYPETEAPELVYIGKTAIGSGLRKRLLRHERKLRHRVGLFPERALFKAVRVYVFTAIDLEGQLIDHYGGVSKVSWNNSGFGSNDPGKERDTTFYKADHFEARYPINLSLPLGFDIPLEDTAENILKLLKAELPYLIRFQLAGTKKGARKPHDDLRDTRVRIDPAKSTLAEDVIAQVIRQLPPGWHATALPSHTIIYKNDARKFPSGREIARSG